MMKNKLFASLWAIAMASVITVEDMPKAYCLLFILLAALGAWVCKNERSK